MVSLPLASFLHWGGGDFTQILDEAIRRLDLYPMGCALLAPILGSPKRNL